MSFRTPTIIIVVIIVILSAFLLYQYSTSDTAPAEEVPVEATYDTKVVYTTNMDTSTSTLKADCTQRGGTFNSCGNTCAPDADVCTTVCAYTCEDIGTSTNNTGGNGTSAPEDARANGPAIPDTWETYRNPHMGFSLKHPSGDFMTIRPSEIPDQGPSVHFFHWGPTQQENTEIYDGISVKVTRIEYTGSVEDVARDAFRAATATAQRVIERPHQVTFGGVSGYAYRLEGQTAYTNIYIPTPDSDAELLRISWVVADPTDQGFEEIVNIMQKSFTIVE